MENDFRCKWFMKFPHESWAGFCRCNGECFEIRTAFVFANGSIDSNSRSNNLIGKCGTRFLFVGATFFYVAGEQKKLLKFPFPTSLVPLFMRAHSKFRFHPKGEIRKMQQEVWPHHPYRFLGQMLDSFSVPMRKERVLFHSLLRAFFLMLTLPSQFTRFSQLLRFFPAKKARNENMVTSQKQPIFSPARRTFISEADVVACS